MDPVLEADRVILRPPKEDEVEGVYTYAKHPDIGATIPHIPQPYEKEHAEEWIEGSREGIAKEEKYALVIYHPGEDEVIGTVALSSLEENNGRTATAGYWIAKPYWGNGYATEALNRILEFGFNTLNLHKISATVLEGNIGSIRVLEKAGFTEEGYRRDHEYHQDEWHDRYEYGLLEEEYQDHPT